MTSDCSESETVGVKVKMLAAQSCLTLCNPMDYSPPAFSVPWDSPGKNIGVGCRFLLQGIFPTQGWNPCLLHWQADSVPLSHQGSPYIRIYMPVLPNTKVASESPGDVC